MPVVGAIVGLRVWHPWRCGGNPRNKNKWRVGGATASYCRIYWQNDTLPYLSRLTRRYRAVGWLNCRIIYCWMPRDESVWTSWHWKSLMFCLSGAMYRPGCCTNRTRIPLQCVTIPPSHLQPLPRYFLPCFSLMWVLCII
jgi:hypothetical protein